MVRLDAGIALSPLVAEYIFPSCSLVESIRGLLPSIVPCPRTQATAPWRKSFSAQSSLLRREAAPIFKLRCMVTYRPTTPTRRALPVSSVGRSQRLPFLRFLAPPLFTDLLSAFLVCFRGGSGRHSTLTSSLSAGTSDSLPPARAPNDLRRTSRGRTATTGSSETTSWPHPLEKRFLRCGGGHWLWFPCFVTAHGWYCAVPVRRVNESICFVAGGHGRRLLLLLLPLPLLRFFRDWKPFSRILRPWSQEFKTWPRGKGRKQQREVVPFGALLWTGIGFQAQALFASLVGGRRWPTTARQGMFSKRFFTRRCSHDQLPAGLRGALSPFLCCLFPSPPAPLESPWLVPRL